MKTQKRVRKNRPSPIDDNEDSASQLLSKARKRLQVKWGARLLDRKREGGIFTDSTRRSILGLSENNEKKSKSKNRKLVIMERYRIKKYVETAIDDLCMYLEALPISETRKTMRKDVIEAFLLSLFRYPRTNDGELMYDDNKPDFRPMLALTLAQNALSYLLDTATIRTEMHVEPTKKMMDMISSYLDPEGYTTPIGHQYDPR